MSYVINNSVENKSSEELSPKNSSDDSSKRHIDFVETLSGVKEDANSIKSESNIGLEYLEKKELKNRIEGLLSGLDEDYSLTIYMDEEIEEIVKEKMEKTDPVSKMELVNTVSSMIFSPDLERVEKFDGDNYLFHYTYPFIKTFGHNQYRKLISSNTLLVGFDTEEKLFDFGLSGNTENTQPTAGSSNFDIYNNVPSALLSSAEKYVDSGVPVDDAWREVIIQYFSTEYTDRHSLLEGLVRKYREIITDEYGFRERANDLSMIYKMMEDYGMDFLSDEFPVVYLSNTQRRVFSEIKGKTVEEVRDMVVKNTRSAELLRTTYHKGAKILLSRVGLSNTQFVTAMERCDGWSYDVAPNIVISEDMSEKAYVFYIGKGGFEYVDDDSIEPAELEDYKSYIKLGNSLDQDRDLVTGWVSEFRKKYPRFPFEIDITEFGSFHEVWRNTRVLIPFSVGTLGVLSGTSKISSRDLVEEWGRFLGSKIKNME